MELYTARISYKEPDRLDITVAGRDSVGRMFAPSWKMVTGLKQGLLSEEQYRGMYRYLMETSKQDRPSAWTEVLNRDVVTLVCFCRVGEFCHRYLLAKYLEELGANYKGERPWK